MKLTMKSLIGNLLFIAIILLLSTRVLSVVSGTSFPIDLITSDSMSPSLMEGDIVAWTPTDISDVEVGDVIVYKSWLHWPEERIVMHRVVKVEEDFGKIALITKGDANIHTDQSGPHIPEPYVSNKNLLGKAISIGQQPLKIPLVGYIGLWTNEVFRKLAAPTAEKGSIAYVGVFSPLTISIIFLIGGIFILPEKNKTLNEKLRYYILGSHSFNLKKIFISFISVYLIFLLIIHCFAYDSLEGSLGIGEFPKEGSYKLGSVSQGSKTIPKAFPINNPGIMPLKGILFGKGELSEFVDRNTFILEPGEQSSIDITATSSIDSQNGVYTDQIMIYSSPFWILIPDELMQITNENFDGQFSIFLLDLISALLLTSITISIMVGYSLISQIYTGLSIDLSWKYKPHIIFKKNIIKSISKVKKSIRTGIGNRYGWIGNVELIDVDLKKPILASLFIIPILLFISSELLAMVIASVVTGIVAYFISCKTRNKIILTVVVSSAVIIVYTAVKTNLYLLSGEQELIEMVALGMGAVGVYILVLSLLLVPLSLISWYLTSLIRNVKEQKEPYIILEGSCDL